MRDINLYAIECMDELDRIGIEYGNVIDVKVNKRAKKRFGRCRMIPGGYEIEINEKLLYEENSVKGLKDTIHHELLHTVAGCMNHGKKWKAVADRVNEEYGYNIKRCSTDAEKGVTNKGRMEVHHKYAVKCNKCGHVHYRERMCNVIRNPRGYLCKCGGSLERIL